MTETLAPTRADVLGRRLRIVVGITITWNVVEAVVALAAGAAASSAALIGFGLDAVVEVLSAAAVAWQFAAPDPERRERAALRVISASFFGLAAYVSLDAVLSLLGLREPEHSAVGIWIAALSLVVMPFLSWFERRTGRELGSASAVADSKQTLICTYLSAALLVGLVLNSVLGWAWADSVAALVIAGLAVREGRSAWKGDVCCVPERPRGAEQVMDHRPTACALSPDAGREQVESWRAFDAEHLLDVDREDERIVARYARSDSSTRRLRELVAVESRCCASVEWRVEEQGDDLRLVVTGSAEQLSALNSTRT